VPILKDATVIVTKLKDQSILTVEFSRLDLQTKERW